MSEYRSSRHAAFASREQRSWRRNQNTAVFVPSIALGPIAHTVIVGLMVAVLGLIYLTQVTKTSTYSYRFEEKNEQLEALLTKKRDLEVENARLQALERVSQSDVAKALVEPSAVEYAQN